MIGVVEVDRRIAVGRAEGDDVYQRQRCAFRQGQRAVFVAHEAIGRARRRDRTKPLIGDKWRPSPPEKIKPDGWLAE